MRRLDGLPKVPRESQDKGKETREGFRNPKVVPPLAFRFDGLARAPGENQDKRTEVQDAFQRLRGVTP